MELDRLITAKSLSKNAVLCLADAHLVSSVFLYSGVKIDLTDPFKLLVPVLMASYIHHACWRAGQATPVMLLLLLSGRPRSEHFQRSDLAVVSIHLNQHFSPRVCNPASPCELR